MEFYHHKITPLWPLANGMVENFTFLRNYCGTPHPTTISFCFKEDKFVHDCLK